jgi:nitroreductase
MNVFEAIQTMLAVRSYRDDPIPDEVVTQIVEAGRLTGSSRNTQQWDFVVIQDRDTLARLGELARTGSYIAAAPLAVAVVVPDAPVGYMDGARATQDMMLAAWEAGVGSNWVGNVNTGPIKQLLNIPADRLVLNIIPFGYPAREVGKGRKDRKPLAEVAHNERFGQPYTT